MENQEEKFICKWCNKECKNKNALAQHEIRCDRNPNTIVPRGSFYCQYCSNEFTTERGKNNHETYCEFNLRHIDIWCKGQIAETNASIALRQRHLKDGYVSGRLVGSWKGRTHTEEEKEKISVSRKKYLTEHPDQVPYILNHSSRTSYPEQYFIDLFEKENIDLKYHKQISKYQLDFYNLDKKIDVEIDGEQHFTDKRIFKSDRERDIYFQNLGWIIYRIRWSDYQKLTKDQKGLIVAEIKQLLESSELILDQILENP